jgi:hypothetical protein
MSLELLIPLIFIVVSLLSSLIKKLRGAREPDETKLQRRQTSREVGTDDPFEEEIDLSEWDVLFGPPEPESKLEPKPEFQEVQGKRPVSEADTGPEFQEVEAKRPVSDKSSYIEGKTPFTRASETERLLRPKRRKRRIKLDFEPNTIRKAIIYNEIIGPPRAETDHFKNP